MRRVTRRRNPHGLLTVVAVPALAAALLGLGWGSTSPRPAPSIPWATLRNPILGYPDRAVKDPALMWTGTRWVAMFSQVGTDGRWSLGVAASPDLRAWSSPTTVPHDAAVDGDASPDVVRAPDGTFIVTDQSFVHDVGGGEAKLYYRTTRDFQTFSPARPLARSLHPGPDERMIDAAVEWTPAGLLLGYKVGGMNGPQAFEIARSTTGSLDGPWTLIGRPAISVYGDTIENYQFVHLNGGWQLLATSNQLDRPYLFELAGNPRDPSGWLRWSRGQLLHIPQEAWNPGRGATGVSYEHANCAFFVDRGPIGGHFYVVYADSPELSTFAGSGHDQLAIARSRDLRHWSVQISGMERGRRVILATCATNTVRSFVAATTRSQRRTSPRDPPMASTSSSSRSSSSVCSPGAPSSTAAAAPVSRSCADSSSPVTTPSAWTSHADSWSSPAPGCRAPTSSTATSAHSPSAPASSTPSSPSTPSSMSPAASIPPSSESSTVSSARAAWRWSASGPTTSPRTSTP